MPYFCSNCGEKKNFYRTYSIPEYHSYRVPIDENDTENGEEEEIDIDNNWTEPTDNEYECQNCGWHVEEYTEIEILEIEVSHIDKEGKWHKEELLEEERNEELMKELIARKI